MKGSISDPIFELRQQGGTITVTQVALTNTVSTVLAAPTVIARRQVTIVLIALGGGATVAWLGMTSPPTVTPAAAGNSFGLFAVGASWTISCAANCGVIYGITTGAGNTAVVSVIVEAT